MMEEFGRIVPRALKQHVRRDQAPLLAVVTGLWPRVAGKAIAEQARPVAFSAGALTLTTSSDAWAVQLKGLSGEICAAVNKALGQPLVKQLRVRLVRDGGVTSGQLSPAPATPQPPPAASGCTGLQSGADSGALAALDPETREILSHSFAKYFARVRQEIN
jgi:hypothetical protein